MRIKAQYKIGERQIKDYIVISEIIFKKSKLIRKIIEIQKQSKNGRKQNGEQMIQIQALSKSRFKRKYVSNITTAISNTKIKTIDSYC